MSNLIEEKDVTAVNLAIELERAVIEHTLDDDKSIYVTEDSLPKVFAIGLFSNVLNPKPGLFVLAFIPQFVSAARGPVHIQMLVFGAIFAVLTAVIFSILGSYAAKLSTWLESRPKVTAGLNLGAGAAFIASGVSILALGNRR